MGLTGIKFIPRTFTVITYCPESGNLYDDRTIPFGVCTNGWYGIAAWFNGLCLGIGYFQDV